MCVGRSSKYLYNMVIDFVDSDYRNSIIGAANTIVNWNFLLLLYDVALAYGTSFLCLEAALTKSQGQILFPPEIRIRPRSPT